MSPGPGCARSSSFTSLRPPPRLRPASGLVLPVWIARILGFCWMKLLRQMKSALSPESTTKTIYVRLQSTEQSPQNIVDQLTWALIKSFVGFACEEMDVQYWDPRQYVVRHGDTISANDNIDQRSATLKLVGPSETDVLAKLREYASPGIVVDVFVYTEMLPTLSDQDVAVEPVDPEQYQSSQMCNRSGSGAVLTHQPTGISARSTFHRAHWQNKQEAERLLAAMLFGKLYCSSPSA